MPLPHEGSTIGSTLIEPLLEPDPRPIKTSAQPIKMTDVSAKMPVDIQTVEIRRAILSRVPEVAPELGGTARRRTENT